MKLRHLNFQIVIVGFVVTFIVLLTVSKQTQLVCSSKQILIVQDFWKKGPQTTQKIGVLIFFLKKNCLVSAVNGVSSKIVILEVKHTQNTVMELS